MPVTRSMVAAQVGDTCLSNQAGPSSGNSTRASIKSRKSSGNNTSEKGPPAKRVKTTQVPRRAKKASLRRLLDMPPEVFNEIATHLLPMDLLSLARSNKFFRTMFMSRTSLHLWRQSLTNAPEIPSCPPDLNEPQYISLLFSKTCSSCGARVLRRMDPYLHVRLCNLCRDEQTMEFSVDNPLLQFLPQSEEIKDTRDGITYTLESDFFKIRDTAVDELDEDTFIEWQKAKYDEVCKRHDHGALIGEYLDMMEDQRIVKLDELKRLRHTQIETRLYEEGWSKKDMDPTPDNTIEWNKLIYQPKPITDRIWANLRPKLVGLLESNRTYHGLAEIEKRRRELIDKLHAPVSDIEEALLPLVPRRTRGRPVC